MEKINDRALAFALQIIELVKYLNGVQHEFVLAKQILRSGTSIGANLEEGYGAQSDADFVAKFSIAYKEARETAYWLKLLRGGEYLPANVMTELEVELNEITRIIAKIILTKKGNMAKTK